MYRQISELIEYIYGKNRSDEILPRIESLIARRVSRIQPPEHFGGGGFPLDEKDAYIITSGDQFLKKGQEYLETLKDFFITEADCCISGIHILPFTSDCSDENQSVSDYKALDPEVGEWRDVENLSRSFKLMCDLSLNRCSSKDSWFSSEKDECNLSNPEILLKMLDVFLFYIQKGIQIIRLDAIAYSWRELGHPESHHPKIHAVVKLFRTIVDEYAPWVVILKEARIPEAGRLTSVGAGIEGAQMLYQPALPTLVLDAFLRADASHLQTWAAALPHPDGRTTFYNFLANRGGIEILPSEGLLPPEETSAMFEAVRERGGKILYKVTVDEEIPRLLEINFCDAVAEKELKTEMRSAKFLASQSIMLTLPGVPGVFIDSLIGSGHKTVTEQKFDYEAVVSELRDPASLRGRIFEGYKNMLRVRTGDEVFHPASGFRLIESDQRLFCIERISEDTAEKVFCIVNVSEENVPALLPHGGMTDILTGRILDDSNECSLKPYEILWLK